MKKAPRQAGLFSQHLCATYRLPEPGPDGVMVDPLGEPLGASVLPDGFVVAPEPVTGGVVVPVLPVALPVVPFTEEPLEVPLAAEPPAVEPAAPPVLWASANVLESASAPANAIVAILMVVSFADDPDKTGSSGLCSPPPQHDIERKRAGCGEPTWRFGRISFVRTTE
jgi:hypothetical protein